MLTIVIKCIFFFFRKLLLNQKGKNLTELEYIRNVFAFKLWKRLYGVEEKKAISEMALCELSAPKTLTKNYWNYKFLPQNINPVDIHNVLITAMFDIQIAIKVIDYLLLLLGIIVHHFYNIKFRKLILIFRCLYHRRTK